MVENVYLVRHGHIDTGGEKRYIGQTDLPLDALGIAQAHRLCEYFKTIPLDRVFTSPLVRCVQTTRIICNKYQCVEAFREIHMGAWENMAMATLKAQDAQAFAARGQDIKHFVPPGGESFEALSARVLRAFKTLVQAHRGTVLIVAHAGVNRVILRQFLGIGFQNIFSINQPYGSVHGIFSLHH
ncbi:MAG: histidine phosphatase family protein [Campylobacterales bacterium]|nr:histidine phosphatase family protein [Campylobacterales bacterium]